MDERRTVVEYFQKNSVFIQAEAVDFMVAQGNCLRNAKKILDYFDEKPLSILLQDVQQILGNILSSSINTLDDPGCIKVREGLQIIEDVTGNSCCEGTISDFMSLFKDRYKRLHAFLYKRQEMKDIMPIKKAQQREGSVGIIGIINGINRSKNGHVLIEIEDETDCATVYVPDSEAGMASSLVEDEIIGVVGKGGRGGLIIAQTILRPDIPLNHQKHHTSCDAYVAFISDLHIGSKTFLEKEWQQFIRWCNGAVGSERQKKVAKQLKYLILPGDIVEGVGIYPRQEADLLIENIYDQYEALAQELQTLPDEINIIMQPGNHDAVRLAIPQPAFDGDVKDIFSGLNITFVGNPCYMSLDGVEILIYHGQSLVDFSACLGIDQNSPTEIMKHMLQCRHMAPIYGDVTPLAPERRDYLVIDQVPDIFVTGHVHTTAMDRYRGVLLINASTWQSQTEYQRMMNFFPDPAKVSLVNLHNGHANLMDFSR